MNNTSDAPSGVVLSIQMINFMKHDNLYIPLTPNVNFITGRNGSGKSSILVALTVGLGGSTKATGRGSNLGDLIKDGKHEATIIIRIKNAPNGYEELTFGPIITITRKIRQNSSSFEISNLTKKERAREVLYQILQFFSIQVDNPCTIMSQDISREFIGVSTPQRKYELFMKGTLLSRLENEIYKIKGNIQYVENQREERKNEISDLDFQLAEKKRLYDIVMEYDDISKRIRSLQDEIVWSQYNDERKEYDKLVKYLEENKDNLKIQKEKIAKITEEYNIINVKYSKTDEKRRAKHLEIATLKKKIESIQQLKNQNSAQLSEIKAKLKITLNKIENIKKDIEMKTYDLKKLTSSRENADEQSRQKQKRFIAEKEDRREQLQKKLYDINNEFEHIKLEINKILNEYEVAQSSLKLCQSRYDDLKQKREFLKSLSNNNEELSIHSRIDRNINKFSYRPIGPIGHYIHIKDKRWGLAAQNIYGKILKSFIVNSHQDEDYLRQIFPERIQIIITNFAYRTNLNIRPLNYPCCINSLDSIEISSFNISGKDNNIVNSRDIITNVFINVLGVDRIWIFEHPKDAQDASIRHHIRGYTLSGTNFTVQNGYEMRVGAKFSECKIGISDQFRIQQFESDIHDCQNQIEQKKSIINNINKSHHEFKVRKNELHLLRDEIKKELNEIEISIKYPPENEFDYNTQIKNIEERIEILMQDQEKNEKSVIELQNEIIPLKEKKENLKSELQNLSKEINHSDSITDEIDTIQEQRNSTKAKLDIEEKKRKKLEEIIENLKKKAEETKKKVDEDYGKAMTMFPGGEVKFKNNYRPTSTLVTLLQTEIHNYNEVQNSKNIDFLRIQKDYHELKKQFEAATRYLKELDEFIVTANEALEKREIKINKMRESYTRRAKISFLRYQSKRKFDGKLQFNHADKEITIKIKNRNDIFYTDVSELSGGEKSFALVSLLLSLWSLMDTPFYAIDEFDVFMDDINRQAAMVLLIDGAKEMENKQFIFITPLSLDNIKPDKNVSIFEVQ